MAKKIRFPLNMNGTDVRTIEELREHFDLESVLGYFTNGKLVTWLKDRYYDNEANAVEALSSDDTELSHKIMSIFGLASDNVSEEIDLESIQRRNEKLIKLRQFTDDNEIIDNVDCVAFNQDDLLDILDEGAEKIYLCQGEFEVPLTVKNRYYIGIGNPTVKLRQAESMDLSELNIKFKNACFLDDIESQLKEELLEADTVVKEEYIDYQNAIQMVEEYKGKLLKHPSFVLYTNMFITRDFHAKLSYFSDHFTSRDALINAMRNHLQRPYDARRSEVESKSRDDANTLIKYSVYDNVKGNFYHDSIEEISETLQELIKLLQDLGIYLKDNMQMLDINYTEYPSISYQEITKRLSDDVVKTGSGYSIYDYIESYGRINSSTGRERVNGLFGATYYRDVTTYDCSEEFTIACKMNEDLEDAYKRNCEILEKEINSYIERFIRYVNGMYIAKLKEIQKMIEDREC